MVKRWTPGVVVTVPPLALNHVEAQLQSIALSSARAREDIDRLFDDATAPVPAPAETEDASLPALASRARADDRAMLWSCASTWFRARGGTIDAAPGFHRLL